MIRDKMIDQLSTMADEELTFANATFSPFHSSHEGYAVLKEEVEETIDEAGGLDRNIKVLWDAIKENRNTMPYIDNLEFYALSCATEAIQVAAMCRKYRDSLGTDKN